MDSTAIETLSVSAVKDSLSICNYLQPFIAENDREPTWDGTVYIYEGAKKNKDNMTGRVSVQVKGKECNDISKDQIKFQVSTADMANYLNDGGVIYFVVYISSDGSKRRIYYTTLLPVRLKMILSNVHGEKSKSIELQAFPSDNYRKATIFLNFYKNKIKQYSYINKEFLSIEDLQESTGIKNLSFSVSGYGYEPGDEIKAILENEIYLYAVMNEIDLPIPIDLVPENLYVQQNISCVISVKEKQYYTYFTRIESIDSITIEIGQSLKLVLKKTKDGKHVKKKAVDFNFNPTSKLHAWVKDTEFFLDAFKVGSFTIDGNVLKLPRFKQKIDISCEEKKLEYHRKILDMLEILNVKEDLDIGELTVQESREINYLVTALIDKKPVCHLRNDLPLTLKMKIQDIGLLLVFEPLKPTEGTYKIKNFFGSNLGVFYGAPECDEKFITSQYSVLNKEDYSTISNINYNAILPSYQELVESNPNIFNRANLDMLIMISAYDENNNKALLYTAKKIAFWILNESGEHTIHEIELLNYLQIIRRERELNLNEKKQLYSIVEDSNMSEEIKTGSYLLIGDQDAAKIHFEKMTPEAQDIFKQYPIFRFWNNV